MNPKVSIQFWAKTPPSRRDALLTLLRAIDLLSEALPIALENAGKLSVDEQMSFWDAFVAFERQTDLCAFRYDGAAITSKLQDWSEVIQIRANGTRGDLDEEETQND